MFLAETDNLDLQMKNLYLSSQKKHLDDQQLFYRLEDYGERLVFIDNQLMAEVMKYKN
jgi:hypothetical protein